MSRFKFNIRPSPVDIRDFVYASKNLDLRKLVDLREWDSLVEDQGSLGSCAGNAMTNCYEIMVKKFYPDYFVDLSRLYAYYHARLLENSLNEDSGVVHLRNVIKGVEKYGLCREELWPYDIEKYNDKPSPDCYEDAQSRGILEYRAVRAHADMLESLSLGYPILAGFEIFDRFITLDKNDPVIHMPGEKENSQGGHAVAVIGYDLEKQQFLIKNSFGKEWGDQGYAWISFEYSQYYFFDQWCFDITDQSSRILIE
jgi:C1A family cysteine protease